jgi:hypothetical protein
MTTLPENPREVGSALYMLDLVTIDPLNSSAARHACRLPSSTGRFGAPPLRHVHPQALWVFRDMRVSGYIRVCSKTPSLGSRYSSRGLAWLGLVGRCSAPPRRRRRAALRRSSDVCMRGFGRPCLKAERAPLCCHSIGFPPCSFPVTPFASLAFVSEAFSASRLSVAVLQCWW